VFILRKSLQVKKIETVKKMIYIQQINFNCKNHARNKILIFKYIFNTYIKNAMVNHKNYEIYYTDLGN